MISLFIFGPHFGLPEPSPFTMKGIILLKMSGLPYVTDTTGFMKAPKGKLPYIKDNQTTIADSGLIRHYLEKTYHIDFDKSLSTYDKAVGCAVERLCEEHLYFMVMKERWMKKENFDIGPRVFFNAAPALIRPLIIKSTLNKIKRTLWGQGISRHTDTEINILAERNIKSLSDLLGNKKYLFGDTICGTDATLYSFIESSLCDHFDTDIQKIVRKYQNLIDYKDRMRAEFFPEFKDAKVA